MKNKIFHILQSALNRYLALDPESIARLKKLNNKVVTIEFLGELLGPRIIFQLVFESEKIVLKPNDFLTPDTTIKGTPLSLLHMSLTKGDRKHFFSNDSVSIEGDLDLGQDVIDLFDQLEIDWEEYASRWVGDVSAHQLGRVVVGFKKFREHFCESIVQNINEYTHEEIDLFPPAEALQDFFADVDVLRMDVDRIEARAQRVILELRKQ